VSTVRGNTVNEHRKQFNDVEWAKEQPKGAPNYYLGDVVLLHGGDSGIIVNVMEPQSGHPSSYTLDPIPGQKASLWKRAWFYEGDFKELTAPSALRSIVNKQRAEQVAGGNRWRIAVELTWDVKPEDCDPIHEGDTIKDFQDRAFQRVRGDLNSIVGKDKPFAHFHILERPMACVELD
jgi:hypothetical protein